MGTEPSASCVLVVDDAFVTDSNGHFTCSVDTGVNTTDNTHDSDTVSTSDASETSSCKSTVSATSNVPSISLDTLSVVAPASTVSTSMLQSVPAPGNLKSFSETDYDRTTKILLYVTFIFKNIKFHFKVAYLMNYQSFAKAYL